MSTLLSLLGLLLLVLSGEASRNHKLTRSDFFEGNAKSDLEEILSGVNVISIPGSPGFLSVYGSSAFPILAGKAGPNNVYHPVAVGSRADTGKLLGFAHDGFLSPEVPTESQDETVTDKNRFILNSVQWASPVANNISVFLVRDDEEDPFADFLRNNSISVTQVSLANFTDPAQLEGHDVVCIKEFFDSDQTPFLQQHLKTGGGLIIGLTSWAHYYYLNITGHFGLNFPPNMISNEYGFVWRSDSGDSISSPTTQDGNFNASTDYLYYTDIPSALEQVRRFLITGDVEESGSSVELSLLQYSSILGYGLEVIPPSLMIDLYDEALNFTQTNAQPIPTAENPVDSITDKFLLEIFHAFSAYVLTSRDVLPHPASSYFPGAVYDSNDAIQNNNEYVRQIRFKKPSWFKQYQKKYSDVWSFVPNSINSCNTTSNGKRALLGSSGTAEQELVVNNKLPLWFSTGVYAPPGTPIQITIESEENLDDLQVQVGTHTDDISNIAKWPRNPRVILRNSFSNNQVTISSPYGGLIYIIIPERAVTEMEKFVTVRVSGAVRAPYFKLGETSIRKWREQIRYESGPWAEFATENIVISVPSTSVRNMEDPEDLLLFWDQVMDAIADLISIPRERYRQERMVADVQISAGFMHSGYPIMTFLNEGNLAINVTELRTLGSWGHFHELGHNHQDEDWTFSGTGEVTCNLFSLYLLNTVCGIPTEKTRAEMTPEVYRQTISNYIVNGLDFEEWKSNPWLALMFYVQLQKVYGWGAYKQVFAKYHELGPDDHPQTDAEKIDLWLVMFSSVVQENLSVFFQSWGMPVTADATASVASYPEAGFVIFDLLHD